MIWFIGSIALGLMLSILAVTPEQIVLLNQQLLNLSASNQDTANIQISDATALWNRLTIFAVTSMVSLGLLQWIVPYIRYRFSSKLPTHPPVASATNPSASTFLTPYNVIRQKGMWRIGRWSLITILFWLAVVGQGMSQRLEAILNTPDSKRPVYVEALVTPIGISDKRLGFAERTNTKQSEQLQNKVVQDYRQLTKLTQIKPYYEQVMDSDQSNLPKSATKTANPFMSSASSEPIELDPSSTTTDAYYKLPEQLTVMVNSFRRQDEKLNDLAPNQQVKMRLRLTGIEPEILQSPSEFNEYRWLMTRHALAKAQPLEVVATYQVNNTAKTDAVNVSPKAVDSLDSLTLSDPTFRQRIDTVRYDIRSHFLALIAEKSQNNDVEQHQDITNAAINIEQAQAVTLSLLTGDRALIDTETTQLYRFAGISHLLAISGTHVLFLAILVAGITTKLTNYFWPTLYRHVPRWQLGWALAIASAFLYALFAGFDVPAARTAWMLVLVGVARYFLELPSVFKLLLVLAVAMAWQDIFILWQAGFWLSFVAVIVLVAYSQRWGNPSDDIPSDDNLNRLVVNSTRTRITKPLMAFFKLQLWMSIALLPLSLWLFGEVSLWGFVVNLFAIALFGWVIVPLNLLAGMLYLLSSVTQPIANILWELLFGILFQFHRLLYWLQVSTDNLGWLYNDVSMPVLLLLFLATLPWLLPKGMLSRYLSFPIVIACIILPIDAVNNKTYQVDSAINNSTDSQTGEVTIITLPVSNRAVSATLIKVNEENSSKDNNPQAWLLLSGYPSGYNQTMSELTSKQRNNLSQRLHKSLKKNGIDALTGIIVQTATPELAKVVADVRRIMPISYYWQAGLDAYDSEIAEHMTGARLTPQNCEAGRVLQSSNNELTIIALTGWSQIDDPSIWDCTLSVRSHLTITNLNLSNPTNKANSVTTIDSKKNSAVNDWVIYSSHQSRLGALWQLMCMDTQISTDPFKKNWLITSQSSLSKEMIDTFKPQAWHWAGDSKKQASASLKETHLYWQQLK